MTRKNIAEWTYLLGCISAVGALVFRLLFFFSTTMSVKICESTSLKPSSFLQFSMLCFVASIASVSEARR